MEYLLDTNVIGENASKAPDGNVMSWLEKHSDECALSALSLGEIWKSIYPRHEKHETLPAGGGGVQSVDVSTGGFFGLLPGYDQPGKGLPSHSDF
jgi:hypothetical protein